MPNTLVRKGTLTPKGFEEKARGVLMELYDVEFRSESVGNIKKKFDYVSHKNDDMGDVTGDAKYYTLVRGKKLPPA